MATVLLNVRDLKLLRQEMRPGLVVAVMVFFILLLLESLLLLTGDYSLGYIILFIVVPLLFAFGMYFIFNRRFISDIKQGRKNVSIGPVTYKKTEKSYEAGSGNLYIPVLGDIFPKVWGQKMKETEKYFLEVNGCLYETDSKIYNEIDEGDVVEVYTSATTNIFLGFGLPAIKEQQ